MNEMMPPGTFTVTHERAVNAVPDRGLWRCQRCEYVQVAEHQPPACRDCGGHMADISQIFNPEVER